MAYRCVTHPGGTVRLDDPAAQLSQASCEARDGFWVYSVYGPGGRSRLPDPPGSGVNYGYLVGVVLGAAIIIAVAFIGLRLLWHAGTRMKGQ